MPLHTVPTDLAFGESLRHELPVSSTRRHAPRIRRSVQGLILGFASLSGAGTALAVDGVLEINQLCVASGCFAGDTPGFPVQLASNGSYRLTSQLTVPDENTTAIRATADLVTVDLNGFTIIGPVNCSGEPVTSCNRSSGSGIGVQLNASTNRSGSTVKNGLIQGMGNSGITCINCTIMNVSSRSNRLVGLSQVDGIISGSSAFSNGTTGIISSGTIDNSIAHGNGSDGYFLANALVRGSMARRNGRNGFNCSVLNCTALDNLSYDNVLHGFHFPPAPSRSSFGRNSSYGSSTGFAVLGSAFQLDNNRCEDVLCP